MISLGKIARIGTSHSNDPIVNPRGFQTGDFTPGDRIHMNNPHWESSQDHGMTGSNKIYVCKDCGFIDVNGFAYYSYSELQEDVRSYTCKTRPLSDYIIESYFQPKVPDVCKSSSK